MPWFIEGLIIIFVVTYSFLHLLVLATLLHELPVLLICLLSTLVPHNTIFMKTFNVC